MSTIYDIAEGDVLFVQVGSDGTIETNPDPSDPANAWTDRSGVTSKHLYGVAYNGAVFAAVGQDGIALVSTDGIAWTIITSGVSTDLNAIAAAANVFIAVGDGGVILSSQNGYSWAAITSGTTENLWGVTTANSVYTAVGDNETIVVGAIVSTNKTVLFEESTAVDDTITAPGSTYNVVATEVFQGDDSTAGAGAPQFATVVENLYATQSQVQTSIATVVITDTAAITGRVFQPVEDLLDSFTISDVASTLEEIIGAITDGFTINDAVLIAEVQQIIEAISMTDTMDSAGSIFNTNLSESVSLAAILLFAWDQIESENITIADVGTPELLYLRTLAETLAVTGALPNQLIANEVIALSLVFSDVAAKFFDKVATESLTVSDTTSSLWKAVVEALETVAVSDTATDTFIATLIVADTVELSDSISINQILNDVVSDGFNFAVSFSEDNESYTGWVMNTDSFAVSKYLDYNFNSMCRFNGAFFASSNLGVYELTGADDAGTDIDAALKTGVMSFGTHKMKRVRSAYVGVKSDGTMVFKTITGRKERWYSLSPTNTTHKDGVRVKLGRGVKSVYWQFELTNVDGADFTLDDIELLPIMLSRKV